MKKWIGFFISLFLIIGLVLASSPFFNLRKMIPKETKTEEYRIVLTQEEKGEKKGEADPHFIQLLKEVQKKLDDWLKSLNEKIESEDITRFEVRFLEILRNILEWIKEKVDEKIESSEKGKLQKKEKGIFRETDQRTFLFSKMG